MTITEQLQFSVLTAPVATLDRRALSQAWYSALYGNGGVSISRGKTAAASTPFAAEPNAAHGAARAAFSRTERSIAARAATVNTPSRAEGPSADRRGPRSALARKIERAFLRPRTTCKKASFTVEGEHGRVHVLLQSRGSQLKLVAICPPKARPQVAAALAQARYALAMRGFDLDADTRSAVPC